MSNSNSFVDQVVVIDVELVDVQWHRIGDIGQFEVDVEKCMYRLSGIQHPSHSRRKLVCLLILHSYPFLRLYSPSIALLQVFCALQGLLNDEPVLSFSFPQSSSCARAASSISNIPTVCKRVGLCHCSSPGLYEQLRDLSCKGVVRADQRRDQRHQGRKEFQRLRVSP